MYYIAVILYVQKNFLVGFKFQNLTSVFLVRLNINKFLFFWGSDEKSFSSTWKVFLLWYVVFKLSLIFLLFVKALYESLPGVQVRCDVFFCAGTENSNTKVDKEYVGQHKILTLTFCPWQVQTLACTELSKSFPKQKGWNCKIERATKNFKVKQKTYLCIQSFIKRFWF